jgi:uncharacterized membrane protein
MSESGTPPPTPQGQQSDPDKSLFPMPTSLGERVERISPEEFKGIPVETLNKIKSIILREEHTQTRVSVSRSGPLPPPSDLAAYNEIIPQGADRIMKMAEAQTAHRIEIEKRVVLSQQGQESRGQFLGFVIAIVGMACGTYVAISGQPWAGAAIGGAPLAGIVSIFVLSKRRGKADLSEKKKQMEDVDVPQPSDLSKSKKKKHRR